MSPFVFGPPAPGFYLTGWVWMQVALAKQGGLTDAGLVTRALDESYMQLLEHQASDRGRPADSPRD